MLLPVVPRASESLQRVVRKPVKCVLYSGVTPLWGRQFAAIATADNMTKLHFNHRFLLDVAEAESHGAILDYGCGDGAMVAGAMARGVDFYGVDSFYDGGKRKGAVLVTSLLGRRIFELEGDRIPFPPSYFGAAVSNEVLEHVDSLETVLAELARVVRPGGWVLCIFPTKGTWWEGHLRMPFAHLVPDMFGLQRAYIFLCFACGFGCVEDGVSAWVCAGRKRDYLRRCTRYRSDREVDAAFLGHFDGFESRELSWLLSRLDQSPSPLGGLIKTVATYSLGQRLLIWLVRKRANRVIIARCA